MSGKYLLDSNIIIDFWKGQEEYRFITQFPELIVPAIVIGELSFGAYKSSKTDFRLKQINTLVSFSKIIHVTETTATFYGSIKNQLKQKGRPIPENDIWISAIAMENDMILFTNDKHFKEIDGLKTVDINTIKKTKSIAFLL